uniref:Uncharacterized protein n=1 Tax=Lepeophtheirus salmonis TaxID=72036 RepID=A0A0K2UG49_LEPSM
MVIFQKEIFLLTIHCLGFIIPFKSNVFSLYSTRNIIIFNAYLYLKYM